MEKRYGRVVGWGAYAPEKVVTNHHFAEYLDTNDEWIVQRTGIKERRFAAEHETTSTLGVIASERALAMANLRPTDLDLIIVANNLPDYIIPAISSQIQAKIGATNVPAFALGAGCTGFVYGLSVAYQFIETGVYENILVVGTELISRALDPNDRATVVLFGDGAGAFIVQAVDEACGLESFVLGSDGSLGHHLVLPAGGTAEPITHDVLNAGRQYLYMNGREVFRFASRVLGRAARQAVGQAGLTMDDIDWIVPHQANMRIIKSAARDMGLSLDRFIINVDRYANTSVASIPLAVVEGIEDGRIKPHHKLLLVAFGAGLTWGATVLQMAPTPQEQSEYMDSHVLVNGVA